MKLCLKRPFAHQSVRCVSPAFTLVEIMVSLAVLTILLLISAQVIGQVQSSWTASSSRVSQFREARTAFDILTRNLSQATLNTYIDYDNNYLTQPGTSASNTAPTSYIRRSDLHFVSGPAAVLMPSGGGGEATPGHAVFFQAPLGVTQSPSLVGLDKLMCARGYFVRYSSDENWIPPFLRNLGVMNFRYRLMEYSPPAEKNTIYNVPTLGAINNSWFANAVQDIEPGTTGAALQTRPVADNIIALLVSPRREYKSTEQIGAETESASGPTEIAPQYAYDSNSTSGATLNAPQGRQHLLPPLVRIVLVALDERSAVQLQNESSSPTTPPLNSIVNSTFINAHELESELQTLVTQLRQRRLNYRVFSATIQLKGSKWSI